MTASDETTADRRACGDCAILPGEPHTGGCDVARCMATGGQRLACNENHDHGRDVWTGMWPGEAECREFGWFSVFTPREGWRKCEADTPGAGPDLNRLHMSHEVEWDPATVRWQKTRFFGLTGVRS